jgi:hypothetical protein
MPLQLGISSISDFHRQANASLALLIIETRTPLTGLRKGGLKLQTKPPRKEKSTGGAVQRNTSP